MSNGGGGSKGGGSTTQSGPATGQDIYGQSAGALTGALNSTYGALDQYGGQAPGSNYNPAAAGQPNSIQSGIEGYMNPYTDNVIDRTMGDIDEQRRIALMGNQANADQAGAFGGSRHGLVDAETNRYAMDTMGDVSAQMRNNAYGQAAGLSGQDINNQMNTGFANQNAYNQAGQFNAGQNSQGYNDAFARNMGGAGMLGNLSGQALGMGQSIEDQQMKSGFAQQALNQSVLDQGSSMFGAYNSTPQALLDLRLGSLGQNPLNAATTSTTTKQPGMFDYLSMGAGVAGAMMS
jgi:hypothetical protein